MFESGGSYEWGTPQDLYDDLDAAFGFVLDPAASDKNAKAEFYYTTQEDGLIMPWRLPEPGAVFVNPPYSRNIGKWLEKAYEEAFGGVTVVMLLSARTDTRWWHDYVMKANQIWLIKGRLTFEGADNCAPFPSCIAVFNLRMVEKNAFTYVKVLPMWKSDDDGWVVDNVPLRDMVWNV